MHERGRLAAGASFKTQPSVSTCRKRLRQGPVVGTAADELARLEDLKRRGVITDAEFDRLKAKVGSG